MRIIKSFHRSNVKSPSRWPNTLPPFLLAVPRTAWHHRPAFFDCVNGHRGFIRLDLRVSALNAKNRLISWVNLWQCVSTTLLKSRSISSPKMPIGFKPCLFSRCAPYNYTLSNIDSDNQPILVRVRCYALDSIDLWQFFGPPEMWACDRAVDRRVGLVCHNSEWRH